ncbi:hypothetical protein [Enterobacter roggenkampii]|uniref:hypothetical protein n=1 Tax=Enterobacter roggenkampii TaxID=1812935 RepID=UPI0011AE9D62|nr:hypothetical protein [Enterobacter roggenkampii]
MELLEVSARLEFIGLLTKVSRVEGVTFKEQQIALSLIGEWTAEIDAMVKAEMKNPLDGGLLRRGGSGLQ